MKKRNLFFGLGSRWNKLVKQFQNLYKRFMSGTISSLQQMHLLEKLNRTYKRLEQMQNKVGIKIAGTTLAVMLLSANSFANDFINTNINDKNTTGVEIIYTALDNDGDINLYDGDYGHGNAKGVEDFNAASNLAADESDIHVFYNSSPSFADIDGDGDMDLLVGSWNGYITMFENNGDGTFSNIGFAEADGSSIDVGRYASPVMADIDGDGDLDLFVGEVYGNIKVYTNDGTGSFSYTSALQADGSDIQVYYLAHPTFADIDGDGDDDLFVGDWNGFITKYENNGDGTFGAADTLIADGANLKVDYFSTPSFADIDKDGDLDIFVGDYNGYINIFENDGGSFLSKGKMTADGATIQTTGGYYYYGGVATPAFADIDNDGDMDLYTGDYYGYIEVFTNNSPITSVNETATLATVNVFPNPTSDIVNIETTETATNISIIDMAGKVLINQPVASQNNSIDISGLSNGSYVVKIETAKGIVLQKIVKQ